MQTGEEAGEPNLVPLLDLVFQLIMFFMITVNFVRVQDLNLEVNLPVAQAAVPRDQSGEEHKTLNINRDGKLLAPFEDLNGGRKLEEYLKNYMIHLERKTRIQGDKSEPNPLIVLRADRDVRYKDIWEILEMCKSAGIKRYQFRAMTRASP